jgi:hypothetical protein
MASLVEIVSGMALVASLAAGCSSGSGDGATTSATCEGVCAKEASIACPSARTEAQCVSRCETELSGTACGAEGLEVAACVVDRGTIQCGGEDYVVEEDFRTLCPDEAVALMACSVCQPSSDDSACIACTRTSCCAEMRAVTEDPGYLDWTLCRDACSDSSCQDECDQLFAGVWSRIEAVAGCGFSTCAACQA